MTRRLAVAVVCVAALGAGGTTLGAQTANWLTVGASTTGIRLQNLFATGVSSDVSGVALGASGAIGRGRLALALGYWQGRVDADPGGTQQQDVIDGYALLVVRAQPWLGVKVGAEARSYVTPAGTERWVFWQARLRAGPVCRSAELDEHARVRRRWRLSGLSQLGEPFAHARPRSDLERASQLAR